MKTSVLIFPFDLFGSGGTAAGAELLGDGIREMLTDNKREQKPTRARAYQDQVQLREFEFEKLADYENWRVEARQNLRRILTRDDLLFWITGNHLGVLPVYEELAARYPNTLVLQFDAHLDIYNLSDCTSELSHGNFLLHCEGQLPPLVNLGHRELLLTGDYVSRYYQQTYATEELVNNPDQIINDLKMRAQNAERIFIDVDCDVFDPAYFPALAHPMPFGISPTFLLRILDAVWSEKVIGLAISEFFPGRDQNDRSLATLLWLVEYLLLRHYETLT